MTKKQKVTKTGIFATGLIFFLAGSLMSQFWNDLLLATFFGQLSLQPGTLSYKRWGGGKHPMKMKIYFWNWTNPEEITDEKIKPHFVEMGPYVFWQYNEMELTYNTENATVSYRNKYKYYFDPELSNGTLSDEVTSVNAIVASAARMTNTWSKLILYPLSLFLRSSGQKVWWTKTVAGLLFDGFENPVLRLRNYVPNIDLPDKFAYFYGFNGSVQPGLLNIDSGKSDINEIGQIYLLDYKNESKLYPDCKEIKGSNGDFFAPFVTPERNLEYYVPMVCRRFVRYFDKESTYEGLKTYIFSLTDKSLDNGTTVPENKCYCINDCPRSGVVDASRCMNGPPVSWSAPHFLFADPYYRNEIKGMNPDEFKHKFYSELEPTTGIQINVRVRLQLNVHLTRNSGLSLFSNVPNIYIPIFWMDSQMLVEGEYLTMLQLFVFFFQYGSYIWYGISGAGFATVSLVVLYHFYKISLRHVNRNLSNSRKKNENVDEEQSLKNGDPFEKKTKTVQCAIFEDEASKPLYQQADPR